MCFLEFGVQYIAEPVDHTGESEHPTEGRKQAH